MDSMEKECVKVAVNIRPLITSELLLGCTDCVTVVPGEPQVQIGSHVFTYDHVYGNSGSPSSLIFEECVEPLVMALFHGYNATVLAYGQTGSGKTYTMGTNYNGEDNNGGIIPQVMSTIFKTIGEQADNVEFLIRVSFIEIFKEEVFDLLDPQISLKPDGMTNAKTTASSRAPIQIRETAHGGITLAGVTEAEVKSKEEMASYLARGSLARATGSTNMNSQSSRSHAIFTISLEQKKLTSSSLGGASKDDLAEDILCAKLHLVDLAGSERAKRTGADGLRFKEGVHINRGLLALGNVISALGDEKKRKEGGHVPYRDSKLTRLLQDSLGGNSKTVMIACISPADTNAEETINTLKYANRARNIQNKAIINRDPVNAEMQRLRSQLEQLQTELLFSRGGGPSFEELQILRHKVSLLEASNTELRKELKERQISSDHFAQRAIDAQVEKDKLILKMESAQSGKTVSEIDNAESMQEYDLVKNYVSKIQQLEAELLRAQTIINSKKESHSAYIGVEKDSFPSNLDDLTSELQIDAIDVSSELEEEEKEIEHSSLQDKFDKELQELDKRLEQKEAEMKTFVKVDTMAVKQHYEKKLLELENEKKYLQKEIEDLHSKLANISSVSDGGAQKLKEDYLQKLNTLEAQVTDLKRKQEAQSQLLRQKQKSDEAAKKLQEEIQRIKHQKVQLQHKIKQESEQFRAWKATREKEVLQLKKEGRRNEYEMHKLLALNQRQKMVLQRKTEEASLATKRLKELLEAKKNSSREMFGNGKGPGIQALMQTIEHELEVTLRVHEVRCEYERQLQERATIAKEIAKLKEESERYNRKLISDCPQTMSPSARSSRIIALENMLATSSSSLVSMASQLSEAEERERIFSGRGRWNQVRSMPEAKNLMNYLFNLASSSRCQLRDKEVSCREKDMFITELKEKVVKLSTTVRQLEAKLAETRQLEAKLAEYDTRRQCQPFPTIKQEKVSSEVQEDMDISDSEQSEIQDDIEDEDDDWEYDDDEDEDWVQSARVVRRKSKSVAPSRRSTAPLKLEIMNEVTKADDKSDEKSNTESCCSCSKSSSCKTKKCECRAAGIICGSSCGCLASKCANRENDFIKKETNSGSPPVLSSESESNTGEDEKNRNLVSDCTTLLQNVFNQRPTTDDQRHDDKDQPRMPLSDIGNTKDNIPKPPQRKNWRKSSIQLVPIVNPPSMAPSTTQMNNVNREEVNLRLPRAMNSQNVDRLNPPFSEKNSVKSEESSGTNNKDNKGIGAPSRPPNHRLRKVSEEKENHMA